jgi:hypothetical protein
MLTFLFRQFTFNRAFGRRATLWRWGAASNGAQGLIGLNYKLIKCREFEF